MLGIQGTAVSQLPENLDCTDESSLVARAKHGDSGAFSQLLDRHERKIFRLARHITRNDEDAEDALQDAFLKAYKHMGEFQGQSKFYTWLVRIAVNEALMKVRQRRPGKIFSLDDAIDTGEEMVAREIAVCDDSPEQHYSQEELCEILRLAINDLSPTFRSVVTLRDVNELSSKETACILGISVPAVKSRLLRARLQLRKKLTLLFDLPTDDVLACLLYG